MIIKTIAEDTGISESYLYKISRSASHRYKSYSIPKRSEGERIIHQPSAEIKFLQRWLKNALFVYFPIHDAATGYREGLGIAHNVRQHVRSRFILKLDFEDFFPSISRSDILRLLATSRGNLPISLSARDRYHIANIVCKDGALTIGAPSSPILSNAVMWEFDCYWANRANEENLKYSRYADDICFSSRRRNILTDIYDELHAYLESGHQPTLTLNEAKTLFASKKRNRVVTGLVLSTEGKVSIGRRRKRWIKSLTHKYKLGQLSSLDVSYLRGYLAHVHAVEPKFLSCLKKKYGWRTIKRIESQDILMRKTKY